jgi:hypothetical protein
MCDFGSLSIGELCRGTRQSRGRPAATGASVPAVRQASRRLTSLVQSCLAVEIRTVCDSCRFVTSLTVLSIPAPQRVPRRREKRAPAIWAARRRLRPILRGPSGRLGANVQCRVNVCHRTSATRAPRPCGLRRTCDDDAVRAAGRRKFGLAQPPAATTTVATWLILPVVICLSQRLSHACLSTNLYTVKLRMAH